MKRMTIDEIEEKHGESRIKELEEQLKIRDQQIEELSGEQTPIHIETQKDPHIRFGVISDTHYGSYFHHTAMMHAVYEFFQSEGITRVYHAGDVLDGHNMYKGQVIELQDVGYERQLQRFAKDAPLIEGIETHFITGNHDLSFEKIAGVSPGKGIEAIRPDWVHIGDESARVTFDTNNGPYTIELSHPGGGIRQYAACFSGDTEILTEKGWIEFPNLPKDAKVATLNKETHELEWQKPTHYTDEIYTGNMLHFSSFHYNHLVTPNHRFYAHRPWHRWESYVHENNKKNIGWQMVDAENIKGRDWCIPKNCKGYPYKNPIIPIGDNPIAFAELLGWYISEGSRSKVNKQIQIDQKNKENLLRIIELTRLCGLNHYLRNGEDRDDVGRVVISNKILYKWIDTYCPGKSYEKRVPRDFINAPPEILSAFMKGYLKGDGTKTKRGWHSCCTVSKGLADDIQEIALRLGYSACIKEQQPPKNHSIRGKKIKRMRTRYQVSFNYKILEPAISKPTTIGYSGRVYCVSVPNETIMVRRHGKCTWSGNSYRPQKMIDAMEGGTKPNMLIIGHFHKSFEIPNYRNIFALLPGTLQKQTKFMRNFEIAAHLDAWIIEIFVGQGYNRVRKESISMYI